jgi:hypothetical protein
VVKGDLHVMLYSPRRLETLLGAPVHLVTHQQIADLVGNADAREGEDLDYKREYPFGDKEKKEKGNEDIALDIATFANHLGGLIVVGMAEVGEVPSAPLGWTWPAWKAASRTRRPPGSTRCRVSSAARCRTPAMRAGGLC